MDSKNKKGLIVAGAVLVIIGGAIWYFRKKKKEAETPESDSTNTSTNTSTGTSTGSTGTGSGVKTTQPKPSIPMKVTIPKVGTTVFSSDGKKIIRKTTTANEVVGGFGGYRTIGERVFVLFPDKYNQNKATIVLKSQAIVK